MLNHKNKQCKCSIQASTPNIVKPVADKRLTSSSERVSGGQRLRGACQRHATCTLFYITLLQAYHRQIAIYPEEHHVCAVPHIK